MPFKLLKHVLHHRLQQQTETGSRCCASGDLSADHDIDTREIKSNKTKLTFVVVVLYLHFAESM